MRNKLQLTNSKSSSTTVQRTSQMLEMLLKASSLSLGFGNRIHTQQAMNYIDQTSATSSFNSYLSFHNHDQQIRDEYSS